MTLSATFNISSDHGDGGWDIVLVSSENVQFHVRSSRLLQASTTSFNSLLLPFHDYNTLSGSLTPCILLSGTLTLEPMIDICTKLHNYAEEGSQLRPTNMNVGKQEVR